MRIAERDEQQYEPHEFVDLYVGLVRSFAGRSLKSAREVVGKLEKYERDNSELE